MWRCIKDKGVGVFDWKKNKLMKSGYDKNTIGLLEYDKNHTESTF